MMTLTITVEDLDDILDEIEDDEKKHEQKRKAKEEKRLLKTDDTKDNNNLMRWIRSIWSVGSLCEVYSTAADHWLQGNIRKTFTDSNGDWLQIEFILNDSITGRCKVQRSDTQVVRPLTKALKLYEYTYNVIHKSRANTNKTGVNKPHKRKQLKNAPKDISSDETKQSHDTIDDTHNHPRKYVMGLDCSTQSVTISIYDISPNFHFKCVTSVNVNFDKTFRDKYGIENGIIKNDETLEVTAPTLMFVEALDIALNKLQIKMKDERIDFSSIVSISGSAQQMNSVYWRRNARDTLQHLDPNKSLYDNLRNSFAIENAPSWMDSSTTKQCRALESKVGSAEKVAQISGSRAFERLTGNQIAKIYEEKHDIYSNDVERISLISSFMCGIFIGDYAAIDLADGSGMNLLDINTHKWSDILLDSCAVGLKEKLGDVSPSYTVAGKIDGYFVEKYGFNVDCDVITFSGDNPCSLVGLLCCEEGDVCISLGTSDTMFTVIKTAKPQLVGSVYCSPIHEDEYMVLLPFLNGSISRENIKNTYMKGDEDWKRFNEVLVQGTVGNKGRLAFYYDLAEITPTIKPGIYRFDENGDVVDEYKDNENGCADIRGIIESQFLAMRQVMEEFGVRNSKRILATGGASANKVILQIISDVFGADVYRIDTSDSATKGAGLRALHGYECHKKGRFISFKDIVQSIGGANCTLISTPNLNNTAIYTDLLPRRKKLQDTLPRL